MSAEIDFYLMRIPPIADLSRALPDEALTRLRDIERSIEKAETERLAQAELARRAAELSWARMSGMLSGVGMRPSPYKPSPMPTRDGRPELWLRFARQLAEVRRTTKPLTFHLLVPLSPEHDAQARAIGPEVAAILDRRVDNTRALQIASTAADTLVQLSGNLPAGWPDPKVAQGDLALEAVGALELAGRVAAFLDQNRKAVEFRMRAAEICRVQQQFERCYSNVIARVWAGIAALEHAGNLLAALDFPFKSSLDPAGDPFATINLSVGNWSFGNLSKPAGPSLISPKLSAFLSSLVPHDYGDAASLLGAEARVVRARLHENLGESTEARRLLTEAARYIEPKSGDVQYPKREAFVATMLQAAVLQRNDKPFLAELEQLIKLSRKRALALSYCETVALAWVDVSRRTADHYRGVAKKIASM